MENTSNDLESPVVPRTQTEEEINAALLAELGLAEPFTEIVPVKAKPVLSIKEQIDRINAQVMQIKMPSPQEVASEIEKHRQEIVKMLVKLEAEDLLEDAERLLRTKERMVEIFKKDRFFFEHTKALLAEAGFPDRFSDQVIFDAAAPIASDFDATHFPVGFEPGYSVSWARWLAKHTVEELIQ